MTGPLHGVRVLSLEQAAALPFATRHLADLGAEVIRLQSHRRPPGVLLEPSLYRNKRLVCLDLSTPQGPALVRRLARHCDVFAHNFTPRVMQKYGLDLATLAAQRGDLIYCEVTGFGSTGAWADRPLFGPGAEAVSGHNLLIGEADAPTPGRPGTITYADNVCGLNVLFALLCAIQRRHEGAGVQHLDLSLYETSLAQLGPTVVAHQRGGPAATRVGNTDAAYAWQGIVEAADGAVAMSIPAAQFESLDTDAFGTTTAASLVAELQAQGIAATVVDDIAGVMASERRWRRGYFGMFGDQPCFGPVWGVGGAGGFAGDDQFAPWLSSGLGADNRYVFGGLVGCSDAELDALHETGTLGELDVEFGAKPSTMPGLDIERGLTSRVDPDPERWRIAASAAVAGRRAELPPPTAAREDPQEPRRRLLELPGAHGVAQVGRLFAAAGWDVVKVEGEGGDALRQAESRWGGASGSSFLFLNTGKRSVILDADEISALAATADVVIGDLSARALMALGVSVESLRPRAVLASITPFGLEFDGVANDFTMQAASGFMSLTGEYDQAPQQLPPESANLVGGLGLASAILATVLAAPADSDCMALDLSLADVLTGFTHLQGARYLATGEVPRREGKVKHALRMITTRAGMLYCAPGAVMSVDMRGVAALLKEPRLAEPRFQSAEGRMAHWHEYVQLMETGFAGRTAREWFDLAERAHLTFALVQDVDDLLACPQLSARGSFAIVRGADGMEVRVPVVAFDPATCPETLRVPAAGEHTEEIRDTWITEART